MTDEQPRILIADDDETFRLSTAALLEKRGYTCDCAQDSEEATQLLRQSYDLLIADIRMPGNTELEFLHSVHQQMPELPVVIMTGYPSLPTAVASLRLSISDYLIKPVEITDLQESIVRGLEKGRLLRAIRTASLETSELNTTLDQLEEVVTAGGTIEKPTLVTWATKQYIEQAVAHIAQLLLTIRQVAGGSELSDEQSIDVCRIMRCPRFATYDQALEETVEILARTKHAFKSKELGELRKRLEVILKANRRVG